MTITMTAALEIFADGIEIEADSLEDAKEKLRKMTMEDILGTMVVDADEGLRLSGKAPEVDDYEISDYDLTAQAAQIEYDPDDAKPGLPTFMTVVCRGLGPDDFEDEDSEEQAILDEISERAGARATRCVWKATLRS